jgi:hypothetical protein
MLLTIATSCCHFRSLVLSLLPLPLLPLLLLPSLPQVVSLNNELMSARAEALSAEEAVLWDLSARLMGVLDDVQLVSRTVPCHSFLITHS